MTPKFIVLLALLSACWCAFAEDVSLGMTEADVVGILGEPESQMSLGQKKVMLFPGYKVHFRNGLVRSIEARDDSDLATTASPSSLPYDGRWLEDFELACAYARSNNRRILVNFTGSDWCGWCVKLDREVFSQREFRDFAKENLILLKVDFPKRSPQRAETKQKNEQLARRYGVRGFPTILIIDADGSVHGTTGYQEGGARSYIRNLRQYL